MLRTLGVAAAPVVWLLCTIIIAVVKDARIILQWWRSGNGQD